MEILETREILDIFHEHEHEDDDGASMPDQQVVAVKSCEMTKAPEDENYTALASSVAQALFARNTATVDVSHDRHAGQDWTRHVQQQVKSYIDTHSSAADVSHLFRIGKAALEAFLQSSVTGPPLQWDCAKLLLQPCLLQGEDPAKSTQRLREHIIQDLSVDGEAVSRLIPNVELFALAKTVLNYPWPPQHAESEDSIRWRMRVNVWHQRLLNDVVPSLQESIYADLNRLAPSSPEDLLERAAIDLLHGLEKKAREDLDQATRARSFQYALTGRLGKRTKFQQKDLSQLVVLAKSADQSTVRPEALKTNGTVPGQAPKKLDLNDDTLLENISFAQDTQHIDSKEELPPSLQALDPADQPALDSLDDIILLAHASLMISSAAQDDVSREETVPFAERVLKGGSSNWQIYTQALLVRSRIECYRTRTVERGVLQMQALVDQVVANISSDNQASGPEPTSFLPRPVKAESASAQDRLRYIHQLAPPTRWSLEAELAGQWIRLGGVKTALEIYERLHMWAEVALCLAASNNEAKARKIVLAQLYNPVITTSTTKLLESEDASSEPEYKIEQDPLPADAPRLFCILGDLDRSRAAYERAWEISGHRFARAKRSLAKLLLADGELQKAASAYEESLQVNPQNQSTWFALGCVYLQLEAWESAGSSFSRAVQIDDADAESWSNLAISLLKISDEIPPQTEDAEVQKQRRLKEALVALKHAARLKRDSFRIWQNYLSVSVQVVPPQYVDIAVAQTRLIESLGLSEGEKCVDVPVMEALLADTVRSAPAPTADEAPANSAQHGLAKMVTDLILKRIAPLITASRRLWTLVARTNIYLNRPGAALSAYEKAWRSQLNKPGWDASIDTSSAARAEWAEVADATIDLMDAYESLGEKTKESGLAEGEPVAKDWKHKARSAARSVLARGKELWEDDVEFERLTQRLADL